MSEIKAGDLVMVVKPQPCCGDARCVGTIYRVVSVEVMKGWCLMCGRSLDALFARESPAFGCYVGVLKRIDPLPELESLDEPAEVTA